VVIHARPSEQFEGREGELISINKHKKQEKARSVLLRQKKMQSWLKKLAKKGEMILVCKKRKDGKTLFKRKKKKQYPQM